MLIYVMYIKGDKLSLPLRAISNRVVAYMYLLSDVHHQSAIGSLTESFV